MQLWWLYPLIPVYIVRILSSLLSVEQRNAALKTLKMRKISCACKKLVLILCFKGRQQRSLVNPSVASVRWRQASASASIVKWAECVAAAGGARRAARRRVVLIILRVVDTLVATNGFQIRSFRI